MNEQIRNKDLLHTFCKRLFRLGNHAHQRIRSLLESFSSDARPSVVFVSLIDLTNRSSCAHRGSSTIALTLRARMMREADPGRLSVRASTSTFKLYDWSGTLADISGG